MISITYRGNITSPADNEIIAMDHDQQTLRARLLAILVRFRFMLRILPG